MNNDPIDFLQVKIEKAKAELPEATRKAIDAVNWREFILGLRAKRGYSFEQLGDLELETELLLSGLLSPADYPKELEKRMRLPRAQANALVNEMNEQVFVKVREELIKNSERGKTPSPQESLGHSPEASGEEPRPAKGGVGEGLLAQKLSNSFQIGAVKTEYSLNNISKAANIVDTTGAKSKIPNVDPYRIAPGE